MLYRFCRSPPRVIIHLVLFRWSPTVVKLTRELGWRMFTISVTDCGLWRTIKNKTESGVTLHVCGQLTFDPSSHVQSMHVHFISGSAWDLPYCLWSNDAGRWRPLSCKIVIVVVGYIGARVESGALAVRLHSCTRLLPFATAHESLREFLQSLSSEVCSCMRT